MKKLKYGGPTEDLTQWLTMSEVAKLLDCGMGRTKLYKFLREEGVLQAGNEPYQKHIDAGYFKLQLKERKKQLHVDPVVLVSVDKGLEFLKKIIKKKEKEKND